MAHIECAVTACKVTSYNKPPGVSFHTFPRFRQMRTKWHDILRSRCHSIDWTKSRICSKHFHAKYFDSNKKLKDNAIPTSFPDTKEFHKSTNIVSKKEWIDNLLSEMPEEELEENIKESLQRISEPPNIDNICDRCITHDLKCAPEIPKEVDMWLLIRKQDNLIKRLMAEFSKNKKKLLLRKKVTYTKAQRDYVNQTIEKYKYVVKCLQEKLAITEEQIEILMALESR